MKVHQAHMLMEVLDDTYKGKGPNAGEIYTLLLRASYARGAKAIYALCNRPMWPTTAQVEAALTNGVAFEQATQPKTVVRLPEVPRNVISMQESAAWARRVREESRAPVEPAPQPDQQDQRP